MEGQILFWECKEQESNLILPEHDDDDDDDEKIITREGVHKVQATKFCTVATEIWGHANLAFWRLEFWGDS